MKGLIQDSQSLGQDLNPGPPKYEVRVLTMRPRRLALSMILIPHALECYVGCNYLYVPTDPGSIIVHER
jgi:hypothetical protein